MTAPTPPEFMGLRLELEDRYGIPPDRFCGLDAATMSCAIIAHDCGPLRPGEAVGYNPIGSPETRLGWLRQAFGPDVDVEHLRLCVQFFHGRISEARAVIAGNHSYSHAR